MGYAAGTLEAKAARKKYSQSPAGIAAKRRHNKLPIAKEAMARYFKTQKGQEAKRRGSLVWYRKHGQSCKYKFRQYRTKAHARGLVFDLTFEQFEAFWQKPCHYGGCEIRTIGLDRLNSSIGYTVKNVVPCCVIHNMMKRSLSMKEFVDACKAVVLHMSTKLIAPYERRS